MNILIYKTHTETLIRQKLLHKLLEQLPASLQSKALRYRSELSRYNFVVGRLLLQRGLAHFGLDTNLEHIEFLDNGKPVLADLHFNIAHSDHLVVGGFSQEGQLGLDIEKISPIDFDDFTAFFSPQEWAAIKKADDPIERFYTFWTRKESIIKANGLTLKYLHQMELDMANDHFVVDGKTWHLRDIAIKAGFAGAICSAKEINRVEVEETVFEALRYL